MNRTSLWAGFLVLWAGSAFAGPPKLELRLVLEVHTDDAVQGGMTPEQSAEARRKALDQTVQAIRSRLDQYGVDDPEIKVERADRISIRLPAVEDPKRVSRLISSNAQLEFRLVGFPPGGGGVDSREEILQHYGGSLPEDLEILEGDKQGEGETDTLYYAVEKQGILTGRDFRNARAGRGSLDTPIVEFQLQPQATAAFGEATGANVGSGLAIVLNGRVVSAPRIQSRIDGGVGMIEGNFAQAEVQDLVTVLRSGALPVRVTVIQEDTRRASASSLRRKEYIGLAALVLIFLVILGWQRRQQRAV